MARTKDPKLEEARRAQVLDAAVKLLASKDSASPSLDEVAREAGVSKGLVTYWFPNKEALVLAAFAHYHQRISGQLLAAVMVGTGRQRLESLIRAGLPDRATVERDVRFHHAVWTFAREHPSVLGEVRDAARQFRQGIRALIAIGQADGYVTKTPPPGIDVLMQGLIDGVSLSIAFDPSLDLDAVRADVVAAIDAWIR